MKLRSLALYSMLAGMGLGLISTPVDAMLKNSFLTTKKACTQILSTTKNTLLAPIVHPFITTTAGLAVAGLGVAYLVYCNKNAKDWTSVIDESKQITRFMINQTGKPDELMYWQNQPKASGNWPTAAEIIANPTEVYNALKNTPWIWSDAKTEQDFIVNVRTVIKKEKAKLVKVFEKLENILSESDLRPNILGLFNSYELPAGQTNIVQEIVHKKMTNFNCESTADFNSLSKKEVDSIDRDIMKRAMPSVLNLSLRLRDYALPFEANAIREYWRVYQLIQRLEALKEVLTQVQQMKHVQQEIILEAR